MNILPKKSWHVRTRDNIERVRKDEAQAAEEEKERQRRVALAESEARTEILRTKSRKRTHEETVEEVKPDTSGGHINFFSELEEGKKEKKGNAEYEAEKKAEKEKHEKDIGLLTYLGQSAIESQTSKPWYSNVREKKRKVDDEQPTSKHAEEFNSKGKRSLDPIQRMSKYVEQTERYHDHKHGREKDKYAERDKRIAKRRLENNKKLVKESPSPVVVSGSKTIEQLRAERVKREQEERAKAEKLMAKLRGEKPVEEESVNESRYNSQFNPDFVRRPHKHRP